jgi:class 3 adenylate cyclase
VHERLLAGGDQAGTRADDRPETHKAPQREERKVVTVLAAELESVAASDDPEDLRVTQSRLLQRIRSEVARFGGTTESGADRVLVALFGAIAAQEDHAERAVRAALRLRELELAPRVGVATGEVLVAPDASAGSVATVMAVD